MKFLLKVTMVTVTLMVILGMSSSDAVADAEVSESALLKIEKIEPTVLFKKEPNGLMQAVDITIENVGQAVEAQLNIIFSSHNLSVDLGIIETGAGSHRFYVPEISKGAPVKFELKTENEIQDSHGMSWTPRKHWEVCMIPIAHHDLGYTASVENVMRAWRAIYKAAIQFCEETENYPYESKFRYSIESGWSIQNFIASNLDKEVREKLAKYIKEGRIEIQALYGDVATGLFSHEELIRLMYPSVRMNNEYGGPTIQVGSITDMPGFSWGLPTVLAGAGVKYFFAGLPTYFEWKPGKYGDIHTFWDEKSVLRSHGRPDAFYWEGPDGSKVLTYYQGGYGCWGPKSYDGIMDELPAKLNDMDDRGSPFSVARYAGYGCGDNVPTDIVVSHIVREWNSKWAYPKLFVSTSAMFFEKLAEQVDRPSGGEGIRTFSGDLPGTDYVVGALSASQETAINRRTQAELPVAEKFATMAHLLLKTDNYPADDIRNAYDNMMLYDEHCWGTSYGVGNIPDWAASEKTSYAYKASGITDVVFSGRYSGRTPSANAGDIAKSIDFGEEGQYIVVFNSLSFDRNDLVTVPSFRPLEPDIRPWNTWSRWVPPPAPMRAFQVIDVETGQKVPHQLVELKSPLAPVLHAADRYSYGEFRQNEGFSLSFVAENVPAMGYKTYKIVATKKTSVESTSLVLGKRSIENRFFKVTLNSKTGTVKSIYDKELGIELVDQDAPHELNQVVTRVIKTGKQESPKRATIRKGQNGPVYASLLVSTRGAGITGIPGLTQEIILYDKIKRVDFANRVLKDQTPVMEVYFAFPFKMDNPDFRFEGPLSVIKPLRDQFPGSNSNYYSVQNWADVSDGKVGITFTPIDAHLLEFGGLQSTVVSQAHHGVDPHDFLPPFVTEMTKGHMYSFVIYSNFRTNMPPAQLGDILYRYSITTHKGNWIEGRPRDFGWAARNPLLPVPVSAPVAGPWVRSGSGHGRTREMIKGTFPKSFSFCQIDKPNVILLTLKKAENDEGIIIRLNETEGRDTKVSITLPHTNIDKAYETNLIEVNGRLLDVQGQTITINVRAFGVQTIRIIS